MRCFYCEKLEAGFLPAAAIPAREQKHLFQVLRGKEESRIMLIDGNGSVAEAVIEDKKSLRILAVKRSPIPETRVHLFVAPPRRNQMDQLLKQAAEVGIWSITPIITERSVSKPEKGTAIERMKVLLLEGCKQSHNPFLPELNPIKKLPEVFNEISNFAFFGSTANCGDSQSCQTDLIKPKLSGDIAWLVGPEGGLTAEEENLLQNKGSKPLQLGHWVMRVETAAIAGAVFLAN